MLWFLTHSCFKLEKNKAQRPVSGDPQSLRTDPQHDLRYLGLILCDLYFALLFFLTFCRASCCACRLGRRMGPAHLLTHRVQQILDEDGATHPALSSHRPLHGQSFWDILCDTGPAVIRMIAIQEPVPDSPDIRVGEEFLLFSRTQVHNNNKSTKTPLLSRLGNQWHSYTCDCQW